MALTLQKSQGIYGNGSIHASPVDARADDSGSVVTLSVEGDVLKSSRGAGESDGMLGACDEVPTLREEMAGDVLTEPSVALVEVSDASIDVDASEVDMTGAAARSVDAASVVSSVAWLIASVVASVCLIADVDVIDSDVVEPASVAWVVIGILAVLFIILEDASVFSVEGPSSVDESVLDSVVVWSGSLVVTVA